MSMYVRLWVAYVQYSNVLCQVIPTLYMHDVHGWQAVVHGIFANRRVYHGAGGPWQGLLFQICNGSSAPF